jgi:hypothetical protein
MHGLEAALEGGMNLLPQTHLHGPLVSSAAALDLRALVGSSAWSRLPVAVQRRFAAGHGETTYDGAMDLHCSGIGRVFAALSWLLGGPLTGVRRSGVPCSVRVRGNAQGGVVWERRFAIGDAQHDAIVRSTKELGPDGRLFERTDGGLGMALAVFEHAGALVFESRRYELVLGTVRLRVPSWMTPGVCRVTHTDLGASRFRFTLEMTHPLWGRTFHQTGVFTDPSPVDASTDIPESAT